MSPELEAQRAKGAEPGPAPEHARFALFDAVLRWLERIAADSVLVVVLDDLHWADAESLLLAAFVAAEISHTRILLIGMYRDHDVRTRSTSLRSQLSEIARVARPLPLVGLDRKEVEELVFAAADDVPALEVGQMHQASGGNPFFLNEIVSLFTREGARNDSVFRVPEGVRETLLRRLDVLSPQQREVLDAAAVVGQEFASPVVAAVLEKSPECIRDLLDVPAQLGLLGNDSRTLLNHHFAHALMRETLLAELPAATLAQLHRRTADALTALHSEDLSPVLGRIAGHLLSTGDPTSLSEGIDRSIEAARQARRTLGYEEAASYYERALGTLSSIGGAPNIRLPILLEHGEAQACSGDLDGCRATFLEAAQAARLKGEAQFLARAALGYGTGRNQAGFVDSTLTALLEEALEALGDSEPVLRSMLLGRLSTAIYFSAPVQRRLQISQESMVLARDCSDSDPAAFATALVHHHNVLRGPGTLDERLAVANEAIEAAIEGRVIEVQCEARMAKVLDLFDSGNLAGVESELEAVERIAAERRLAHTRWHALVTRATLAFRAGRFEEAESIATAALEVPFAGKTRDAFHFYAGQVFNIRRFQGRVAEFLPALRELVEGGSVLHVWRCALAMGCAEAGELAEARKHFEVLVAQRFSDVPRDISWLSSLAMLAEVCEIFGDSRRASWLYDLLEPEADRHVIVGTQVTYLGPVRTYLGRLAILCGDFEAACQHLELALSGCEAMGAPAERARAEAALADALEARGQAGDQARAQALRQAAQETATSLGMRPAFVTRKHPEVKAGLTPAAKTQEIPAPVPSKQSRTARLHRQGEIWELACEQETTRLKHVKGLTFLQILLLSPAREFHALDLARELVSAAAEPRDADSGAMLDQQAVEAYRDRLRELRADIDEAEASADLGHAELARAEKEAIETELARALGLGGRVRRSGSDAERARQNVTRAINAVLRKIEADCPLVGRHLKNCVRTGVYCAYTPDPSFPVGWTTE